MTTPDPGSDVNTTTQYVSRFPVSNPTTTRTKTAVRYEYLDPHKTTGSDIEELVQINTQAMSDDFMATHWMPLYAGIPEDEGSRKALVEFLPSKLTLTSTSTPGKTPGGTNGSDNIDSEHEDQIEREFRMGRGRKLKILRALIDDDDNDHHHDHPTTNNSNNVNNDDDHDVVDREPRSGNTSTSKPRTKCIGFIYYFLGYITLPKYDPFTQGSGSGAAIHQPTHDSNTLSTSPPIPSTTATTTTTTSPHNEGNNDAEKPPTLSPDQHTPTSTSSTPTPTPILTPSPTNLKPPALSQDPKGAQRTARLAQGAIFQTLTKNTYIRRIRGKKHIYIRRIMVLPTYQGLGIGKTLLKAVTDQADAEGVCSWLFGRPRAIRLYRGLGFSEVQSFELDEGGEWGALVAMVRERIW